MGPKWLVVLRRRDPIQSKLQFGHTNILKPSPSNVHAVQHAHNLQELVGRHFGILVIGLLEMQQMDSSLLFNPARLR